MPRDATPLDIRHLVFEEAEDSRTNGIHHAACRLAREQLRMGHAVRIVLLHETGEGIDLRQWAAPVQPLRLVGHRLFGRMVQAAPSVIDGLLDQAGPDTIVHIHGGRRPVLPMIGRDLMRRRVRYVVTIHGRYAHVFDEDLRPVRPSVSLYLSVFERRFLENAAFVHALTPQEAATIHRIAPRARVEIVENASYSSAFDAQPAWPVRERPSAGYPTFGFCGRYALRHKGLDLLIEGFGRHRAAGGAGRLMLAGLGRDGTEDDELRALAERQGVADTVAVGGPVFGEDKIQTLQSWDFFVQSSRFDGQPIGALEAALNGLPLIVSRATGLGAAVERFGAGFVVGTLSGQGVAEALAAAARVPPESWARLSLAAHRMALEIGDWTRSARRLQDLYAVPGGDLRRAV
ncbi:glycosyltransferase [Methylobacterium nodulans]|uniref:Glycosyl transferase group 1 n=1 Tax=Methylobacterium nodulans (strain LMG 21967 / CNCM I-2342 / ORS 2060) TaxID=460265 RepID=B8IQD3_METNO|nr:glycosyltransferase [Methylobacterium nodulans]ACL60445.1 glycosyl transferase group 1 [Methylobacterium nodulans ORS 2060]